MLSTRPTGSSSHLKAKHSNADLKLLFASFEGLGSSVMAQRLRRWSIALISWSWDEKRFRWTRSSHYAPLSTVSEGSLQDGVRTMRAWGHSESSKDFKRVLSWKVYHIPCKGTGWMLRWEGIQESTLCNTSKTLAFGTNWLSIALCVEKMPFRELFRGCELSWRHLPGPLPPGTISKHTTSAPRCSSIETMRQRSATLRPELLWSPRCVRLSSAPPFQWLFNWKLKRNENVDRLEPIATLLETCDRTLREVVVSGASGANLRTEKDFALSLQINTEKAKKKTLSKKPMNTLPN